MTSITIRVPGLPRGQNRHRSAAVVTPAGRIVVNKKTGRPIVRNYDDGKTDGWKDRVALAAVPHRPQQIHLGPVRVDIEIFFPRPKYLLKASSPAGPILHTAKPDKDNLEKAVLDAFKPLGFWRDDAQACCGWFAKYYVAKGANPGAIITLTFLGVTDVQTAPLFDAADHRPA